MDDYSYGNSKIQIRKDYKEKQFSNPYFSGNKKFNTKLYLKIMFVIFIVYVFIYSDIFRIHKFEVTGNDLISQNEISDSISNYLSKNYFLIIPKDNMIFFSKESIKNDIMNKYVLEDVNVKRGWQSLGINITEKICFLIVFDQKNYYYLSLDGTVLRQLPQDELGIRSDQLPTIIYDKEIFIGEKILTDKKINFILDLDEMIKEASLVPKSYESRGVLDVAVIIDPGWKAYFDINSNIEKSVENLEIIIKNKISDLRNINYIDLRTGDKVYYFLK